MTYKLYACRGCGSMIVEAALVWANLPYALEEIDWQQTGWASKRLKALNPQGQIPVLTLPNGEVLTESAAMILHLSEAAPEANLAPAVGASTRTAFLRWLIFIVAGIYPTFSVGDRPERWLPGNEDAADALTDGAIARRKDLHKMLDAAASGPFFLGEEKSAIDLYVWAMSFWRPRRDWFAAETPKLFAIAKRLSADPQIAAIERRNEL